MASNWHKRQLLIHQLNYDLFNDKEHNAIPKSYHRAPAQRVARRSKRSGDEDEQSSCCNTCFGYNCWWQPSDECYTMEFCRSSSLHGLRFVGEYKAHFLQRVLFTIFFLLGLAASVYLINDVWQKYLASPTIVTFTEQDIPIQFLPFPAITICNVNNVRKSTVERFMNIVRNGSINDNVQTEEVHDALSNLKFLHQICDAGTKSFASKFGFDDSGKSTAQKMAAFINEYSEAEEETVAEYQQDIREVLNSVGADQSCTEMLMACLWQSTVQNCSEIFHPVMTDYGKCCSFNMAPTSVLFRKGDEYANPYRFDRWNKSSLDMEDLVSGGIPEKSNFSKTFVRKYPEYPRRVRSAGISNGLSVLLNPELGEYYCTADSVGFHVFSHVPIDFPHLSELGEAVGPEIEAFIKITPEVTQADEDIEKSVTIENRKCYFSGERKLQYFKEYSLNNCFDECMAILTYEKCTCVLNYMPRDFGMSICPHNGLECVESIQEMFRHHDEDEFEKKCGCYPTCIDVVYKADLTSRPFRYVKDDWSSSILNFTELREEKASVVHIYYADDSTYPKNRKQLYGMIDLIANIGGLLGLCLGFSVLSVAELLYFLIVKICGKNLYNFNPRQFVKRLRRKMQRKLISSKIAQPLMNPRHVQSNFHAFTIENEPRRVVRKKRNGHF